MSRYGILWSGLLLIYYMPYGGNLNIKILIRKLRNSFDSDPIVQCNPCFKPPAL